MPGPIIIKDPSFELQPLDAAGEPTGAAVDLSDDVSAVALEYDQDMQTVRTFGGNYTIPGEVEETATVSVVVGADTSTNWAALVGDSVQARIKDRADATKRRVFVTQLPVDPSLYGTTEKGETRTIDLELPVLGPIEWETIA
jgi:hypothetical protein